MPNRLVMAPISRVFARRDGVSILGEPGPEVIETIRAVAEATGAEHAAFRILPEHNIQGVMETDPAAVVGHPARANPDLARRWQEDLPLNELDQAKVCTDYPVLEARASGQGAAAGLLHDAGLPLVVRSVLVVVGAAIVLRRGLASVDDEILAGLRAGPRRPQ